MAYVNENAPSSPEENHENHMTAGSPTEIQTFPS